MAWFTRVGVKKKNYPAVKIHPGKFEDEPQRFFANQPKFSRFVFKFSRMYFYSRIIFLDGDATADALSFAKAGLTPMVPMYLSGRVTGF